MAIDARPTVFAPDDDPYLWLEEVEGERAVAWVDAQTATTAGVFADAVWQQDRDALRAIYDRPDNLPMIRRRDGHIYNYWTDAANPRGLWRSTTLQSYATDEPEWTVLLDVDALAAAEGQDWVWRGASTLPGGHGRALVRLSPGGTDATVLREYDMSSRCFVEGGFALPASKGDASWLDPDTLLLASALEGLGATRSGYARTVRRWHRGTDVQTAPLLFEAAADSMSVAVDISRAGVENGPRVWFIERLDFQNVAVWIGGRDGPALRIDMPTDAQFDVHGDWLAVKPRVDWTVGDRTWPGGCLLGTSLSAWLAGERVLEPLFIPARRQAVQGFFWSGDDLVVTLSDQLRPVFQRWRPATAGWTMTPITGLPDSGVADVASLDALQDESTGELLASCQGPLTPPSLFLLRPGAAPQLLKKAPSTFDASGLVMTRHEAISSDGQSIPYVQVGPAPSTGPTADAPVHLTGYGGFGLTMQPHYNATLGKLWLERGGTTVMAHLRGGGEFGPAWHEVARREGRHLSHDDFAAIAADLVRRGVTRAGRVAAEGGSNGGLLVANMMTRYPERFGALLCTVPLIDMRRYHKLLAGASWMAEYGDPNVAADWSFLQALSAYHVAAPDCAYPPILLAGNRLDDRVHPGHARKMAAKLQAMGYGASLYEIAAGGHSYGKDSEQRAGFSALGLRFLRNAIGWRDAPRSMASSPELASGNGLTSAE